MCLCGPAVILRSAQTDPLNPKPITEDLSSVPPQAGALIGGGSGTLAGARAAIGWLSGDQMGLPGSSRLPLGQSRWLPCRLV